MSPRVLNSMMSIRAGLSVLVSVVLSGIAVFADTITIDGTRHENVFISEGAILYYVSLPDTGQTVSIPKDDPALGPVEISANEEQRNALYARYRQTRAQRAERDAAAVRAAAAATARPNNFIESTASSLDSAPTPSRDPVTGTPVFELRGERAAARAESPSQVISNPPRAAAPRPGVNPGRPEGGANMGAGSGAAPGGTAPAGRAGGGGAGGGGQGTGQAGTGAGFTNVSELFSTIDDADVGETPNPITGGRR